MTREGVVVCWIISDPFNGNLEIGKEECDTVLFGAIFELSTHIWISEISSATLFVVSIFILLNEGSYVAFEV